MVRPMAESDFAWAAGLMRERRERYEAYSPVFWRPTAGIEDAHARFLRSSAEREGSVSLRTDHGFAIGVPSAGRCMVDDFAVTADDRWAADGRELLLAIWAAARSAERTALRVVTARRDEPKRSMLRSLGLTVAERWWVKELEPTAPAGAWGPVGLGAVEALLVPAPPVYDPGGPVCLLGDIAPDAADIAAREAAALGAVLVVVQRAGAAPADEPALEAAGFHNPSEFYEGDPL